MKMISRTAIILSTAVSLLAASSASYAQDKMEKGGMTKDSMSKDGAMSKDGMKKDAMMSKDGMKKDGMAKDGMKK